ncbi:MAG: FemAB family PEP-CTERM system-associated protein [Gallionella sp.]|nr:FemAB family PEP-CTERM system-associated protein [Gallionella sp.]MDD4946939.1 FemAB family PEP-CTERM system-associated protein [Gallionella sp.]MDD5611569.1 FemAB family PEP-CTERM system-associated protein [Gallionella sp.]
MTPTAAITVRTLQPADFARWDAFVQTCPEATFYHKAGWQTVFEQAFGHRTHYLLAERGAAIVGVLPMTEIKSRLFGHSLVSNIFCDYCGIAAADSEARNALDNRAQALARELGVGHLEYRQLHAFHTDWPSNDLYFAFRKPIDPDIEKNMQAIPRKQRAMVRKGIQNGLSSELDEGVDRFFALFADNVKRHGTPALPKRYFKLLREVFGKDCEILTVLHEGKPISSVLTFYFRDEVLPHHAGDSEAARHLAGNDFKYWELMRRGCERGYRMFDYGRSKRGTGQYSFKKNWGFEPQPLHYEYYLVNASSIPEHNPLNPKYQLFIKLWRMLPMPVANALGPHIVKDLG